MDRLQEIKDRLAAATPGPWHWVGNLTAKDINLQTIGRGGIFVMSFRRWGMRGAAPWFQSRPAGFIEPFAKSARIPEKHNAWQVVGIDHPDADLIAKAPELLAWAVEEIERLRDEVLLSAGELYEPGQDEPAPVAKEAV